MKPQNLLLVTLLFVQLQCKKDTYQNLSATLSAETPFITSYEGSPLVLNLSFDKSLSKPLKVSARIHNDIDNYINDNDYHHYFEYSTDTGKTWKKSTNQFTFIIPKKTKNVKVRINTVDDNDYELQSEFFDLELYKFAGQEKLKILEFPLNFTLQVVDNENLSRIDGATSDIMRFDVNGNNLTPVAITNSLEYPMTKFIIDEKKYDEFAAKSIFVLNRFDTPQHHVKRFDLFASRNVLGYVVNLGVGVENNWIMGLDALSAYFRITNSDYYEILDYEKKEYNYDGNASYTFVHEAGHILSLANGEHIDNTIPVEDCGYYEPTFDECFTTTSWVTTFYNKFYNPETLDPMIAPEFVTDYARTNIGEDMAETLAVYTVLRAQNALPELTPESSTAVKKLHFVGLQQEVPPFAKKMAVTNPGYMGTINIYLKKAQQKNFLYKSPFHNTHKGRSFDCRTAYKIISGQGEQP